MWLQLVPMRSFSRRARNRPVRAQKWIPDVERMPGVDRGNVWSVEEVMRREARLGDVARIIVLDEGGNWRGCGTAWHLAEQGHKVTLVTPDPMVGKELQRPAADLPLRKRLVQLGAIFMVECAITEWHGDGASVLSFLSGETIRIDADALVLAMTNMADDGLSLALEGRVAEVHAIGDGVAPRQAPYAFYEGRKLGREL